jgi:2-octaprenyl-6-methoxyphenol hydroxylase
MNVKSRTTTARPTATDVDVLLVGGGLVGGTIACALAARGITVAVVDTERPGEAQRRGDGTAHDGRVSAIALTSQRLFARIGVWPALQAFATPIRHIRVAEGNSTNFLHYDSREIGGEPFGFMVENRALKSELGRQVARGCAGESPRASNNAPLPGRHGIALFAPARIAHLARGPFGVEAGLADGRLIRARLAVAADGASSRTRAEAGIGTAKAAYGQTAIVCTVRHERPHENIAHELFLPSGPFAILPTKGNRSAIVWSDRTNAAAHFAGLDEDDFAAEIARRAGDFLGRIRLDSPRWTYPLRVQFAHRMVADRLVLAGDAAHAMHPVAGQGFNMGLRDAAALASVLGDAKDLGLDLGAPEVIEKYGRWRRFDNGLMLAMTDGIVRLFSNDIGLLRALRGFGLSTVNRIAPLRRLFARHAMGVVGDLPQLMQEA